MTQPDARRLAWDILIAVEQGAFADAELGRRLTSCHLDGRDRALAARIVYGTLAWQGHLDHIIAALARPPARLDAPVRVLLRLALFQMTRLSRVPDFAAVSTAVELSKSFRHGAASGLVNAVLRRFLREGERIAWPAADSEAPDDLALRYSHPPWLVERWLHELGAAEARALLQVDNEPAPTVVRVNRLRSARDPLLRALHDAGLAARPADFAPDGIVLEDGGDPAALPGHAEGWFSFQGEASQLVCLLAGVKPGDRVWDACAAPGGKTTYLAELMRNEGAVRATDVDALGIQSLLASVERLGITCVEAVNTDAAATQEPETFADPHGGRGSVRAVPSTPPGSHRGSPSKALVPGPNRPAPRAGPASTDDGSLFDVVLVDAPCSGLGTLRQHPEIRWRRAPQDLPELAARQARLLRAAARRVRPGGVLVYATCTIARTENDDVVSGFLREHPEFTVADPAPYLPPVARAFVDASGFFRTFPHRGGLDGFFAVRLNRRE